MHNIPNYQLILDTIIDENCKNMKIPTLLLHSCCAPCSSYVLEYLAKYFKITVFYYNPNIYPQDEYRKRVEEQKDFIKRLPAENVVSFIEGNYLPEEYFSAVKGYEKLGEKSIRCYKCYELRLREAALIAKANKLDYFTTTLSISPHKNAQWINEIGERLQEDLNINYLFADFKKKNGYKRSIELSEEYGLYRQNYCGCVFSKNIDE